MRMIALEVLNIAAYKRKRPVERCPLGANFRKETVNETRGGGHLRFLEIEVTENLKVFEYEVARLRSEYGRDPCGFYLPSLSPRFAETVPFEARVIFGVVHGLRC
ncbi:MAG: hypothetical protein QOF71_2936 [Candidatus Eremiobacteraeota bacterium]|nr:hypothetical protein [Candidatus Eremiobacteraeota bacterium]